MTSIIIPTRLGSTRLPNKLLLCETGKPLICHTVDRALESEAATQVIIASEDQEILDAVTEERAENKFRFRQHVLKYLTPKCYSGTERLAWVVSQGLSEGEIIVNLQGDEPNIPSNYLDELVGTILADTCDVATIAVPASIANYRSPDVVKVVVDHDDYAMYFSRCSIPYGAGSHALAHVGVYAYRHRFFTTLPHMKPTTLQCESLEQLQWLQNGFTIKVLRGDFDVMGIDTEKDYAEYAKEYARQLCKAKSRMPCTTDPTGS